MIWNEPEHAWTKETPKAEDEAAIKVKEDPDPDKKCAFELTEYYKEKP